MRRRAMRRILIILTTVLCMALPMREGWASDTYAPAHADGSPMLVQTVCLDTPAGEEGADILLDSIAQHDRDLYWYVARDSDLPCINTLQNNGQPFVVFVVDEHLERRIGGSGCGDLYRGHLVRSGQPMLALGDCPSLPGVEERDA
jgi:hypothetical protein